MMKEDEVMARLNATTADTLRWLLMPATHDFQRNFEKNLRLKMKGLSIKTAATGKKAGK